MGIRRKGRWKRQKGLCFHCVEPMDSGEGRNPPDQQTPGLATRDHLIPRAKGGGLGGDWVFAHLGCNMKRADAWPTAEDLCKWRDLIGEDSFDRTIRRWARSNPDGAAELILELSKGTSHDG